jgi:hypothetical protein
MASFLLRPRVVLFVAAVSVPVAASGACGSRTACIEYTQAEYAANGNACLSTAGALATFTTEGCPGSIVSVDGPGSFDGEICCYPVTYASVDQSCGTAPGGGTTGFGASTTGFTTVTVSTSANCQDVFCSAAVGTGIAPCGQPALQNFTALQACAGCDSLVLDGGASCVTSCGTLCSGQTVDSVCENCLLSSCPSEWSACQGS